MSLIGRSDIHMYALDNKNAFNAQENYNSNIGEKVAKMLFFN